MNCATCWSRISKAGLENNERCLWVTGKALNAEQARSALRAAVPDLDKRERDKKIEIAKGGGIDAPEVLAGRSGRAMRLACLGMHGNKLQ